MIINPQTCLQTRTLFSSCATPSSCLTDQHNPQFKKMTEEEFIRNNRAINAGKDLPREYLSELFQSISTCAFSLEQTTGSLDMNPSRWIQLINRSKVEQPFHNVTSIVEYVEICLPALPVQWWLLYHHSLSMLMKRRCSMSALKGYYQWQGFASMD